MCTCFFCKGPKLDKDSRRGPDVVDLQQLIRIGQVVLLLLLILLLSTLPLLILGIVHRWFFDKEKITQLCLGSFGGVHRLLKNLSVVSRCRELARGSFCSCQSLSSKVIPRTIRLLENLPATILPKKKSTGQTTSKEEGRSPPSLPPRRPHVSPYWVPASPTSVRHRCWIFFQKGDDYFCQQIPHPYRTTLILALSPSRGLFLFDNRRHNSFHQLLRHSCL